MMLLHLRPTFGLMGGVDLAVLALGAGAFALALALIYSPNGPASLLKTIFYPLFVAVVFVQGIHVVEHVVQLVQVYAFGIPDDEALGLLGYVLAIQGTEEWLHLVFNSVYLLSLYALALPLLWLTPRTVPAWAFGAFALAALGLETWHVVEHMVIVSNVIRNGGCPCPGISDRVLGVTDTQLHFVYNAVAYAGTVIPFWYVVRGRRRDPASANSSMAAASLA